VGGFRDDDLGVLHFNDVPETIVHTMAGVEWIGHHQSLLLNSGIRIDDRDGSDAGGDRQVHGDMALKTPLFLGINSTWNVAAEHYHWGVNPIQQQDYFEMEASLTLQRGPNFAVTWFNDLTTNPLVNSTGNLSERLYGAVEIQWKPASAWTTKLFYGAYKAGIRCAGGQCRQLPGFDGARATVTGNF